MKLCMPYSTIGEHEVFGADSVSFWAFFLQRLLPETYKHWLRVLGYHSDVRQKQLFHLLCKPFLWSKHAVIHAEVRTVFQPEIWLSLAWAAFSSTDCYLYFQSVIPGSFRSVLFPLCVQFIGFGKRSFNITVACASLFRNSRLLVVRDTCRDSERNNFQLAKMPVLVPGSSAGTGDFSAVSVPLCSLHPHLRIRGYLDFFPLLAFEGFESLSIPKLLVSMRVGKETERTAADFGLSGLWFSCRIWRHRYRVNLELRDARPPGSKWGEKDMFLGRFS